jgi:hypothetical protein
MVASVNSWLVREKQLRGRLSELVNMKGSLTSRTSYYGDDKKIIEPTYDVKKVDRLTTDLQNALFTIENAIKESNAKTMVDVDVDCASLMKPIE